MNRIKKWWSSRKIKRLWDFEGRCTKCHKPLNLLLKTIDKHNIQLTLDFCLDHPDDSLILWPVREDIKRIKDDMLRL